MADDPILDSAGPSAYPALFPSPWLVAIHPTTLMRRTAAPSWRERAGYLVPKQFERDAKGALFAGLLVL